MGVPRLGRLDVRAELEQLRTRDAIARIVTPQPRLGPIAQLLATPSSAPRSEPPTRQVLAAAAAAVAGELRPLPRALQEVATRIRRHCAVTQRDAELAGLLDAMEARVWELGHAVRALEDAARSTPRKRR